MNTGVWKEGRLGAVSLVYDRFPEGDWDWILENHAAVGIRGTVIAPVPETVRRLMVQRNWDLEMGPWSRSEAVLLPPGGPLPAALPLRDWPGSIGWFQKESDRVVERGEWILWRLEGSPGGSPRREVHREMLRWLGDHHMRIWCAPVGNIRVFCEGKK
jgi:hypothetical protein